MTGEDYEELKSTLAERAGIQRYSVNISVAGNVIGYNPNGAWVRYADHVEAVKQARDEGYEYGFNSNDTAFMEGYNKGQRDARSSQQALADYRQGKADAIAASVQRVEALECWKAPGPVAVDVVLRESVIAAIKGEQA